MKKKKLIKRIEYIEYITIGLTIGFLLAVTFKFSLVSGASIGLSLGILIQKIIQEKRIMLTIYLVFGLMLGCISSIAFNFSTRVSVFALSTGMLVGTIFYLIVPPSQKIDKMSEGKNLIIYVLSGMIFGGIIGFVTLFLTGTYVGIGLGIIVGVFCYILRKQK